MKSSLIKGIGEVVTDYGAKVMKVIKKGLLGRSLFDFYGDVKADTFKTRENASVPTTPADGKGGVLYTKSSDGKLYYKSNEVSEVEISANGGHTDEDIEDIAGALVATGGTKTGISIAYNDANGDIDFLVDHDAAANFVAAEHYRWDNDIQSTATINHLNLSSDTPGETEVLVVNDGDAVWGHGEKIHMQVRNDEGSTISAGAPLYSKGEIGGSNRILVGVCDANDSAKMPCIGIAHEEMNTTSTKDNFAVVSGVYNTNISGFTSLAVGDNLYIQDDGSLSQSKPTGETSLIQNVGIVLRTNGTICQGMLVSAIGRTNDVPNLDQNALFIGNASNQAVATDAPMVGVITAADAGAARTVLGVDAAGTDNSTNVTLSGTPDYITISGQEITRNAIDLAADVSGTLPVANGGTGFTSLAADSILTGNGSSAIVAESYLTYSTTDEELIIGNPDAGDAQISRRDSSGTDTAGGKLIISAGAATGDAAGGAIEFHSSVAGSSGSSVQSTAEVATISKDGDLSLDGGITAKQREIYFNNFEDKIGTSKVYIPLISALEQTSPALEEACFLAPTDGRIVSVTVRPHIISSGSDCDVTVEISTMGLNTSSAGSWTAEESKVHTMQGTDDYHAFHYVFDNAKHFESGELVAMSIQSDTNIDSGPYTMYWYLSTVVEYDWKNQGFTSHTEYDAAQ